ncbi:uncharacterized protein LOC134693810 isoform X2 [Mytilus trossulus]|uniref:uncharacterized protein LOC134693810 isoform X2 n=1 Tax=Mytilus trossulus TaxID=6551 RepID=UPI0030045692
MEIRLVYVTLIMITMNIQNVLVSSLTALGISTYYTSQTSTDISIIGSSTEMISTDDIYLTSFPVSVSLNATDMDTYINTTFQHSDSTVSPSFLVDYLTRLTGETSSYFSREESMQFSYVISSSMDENVSFSSILFSPSSETPFDSLQSETELSLHTTFSVSTSLIDSDSYSSMISVMPTIQLVSTGSETTTANRDSTNMFPSTAQTITEVITMCSCNSEESHFQSDSDITSSTIDQPCYTSTIHPTTCSSNVEATSVFETTTVDNKQCSCSLQAESSQSITNIRQSTFAVV